MLIRKAGPSSTKRRRFQGGLYRSRALILLVISSVCLLLLHVFRSKNLPFPTKILQLSRDCFHANVLCEQSFPFSYLMESFPSVARSWTPCRASRAGNGTPDQDGIIYDKKDHYEVNICVQNGELRVNVIHHSQDTCMVPDAAAMLHMGLSPSDVAKDYIEVLLAGPERRLQRMVHVSTTQPILTDNTMGLSCAYELRMPIRWTGVYRVQVLVVHSNITLETFEPYRNYVLWDDLHSLTSTPHHVDGNDEEDSYKDAGIWSTNVDGAHLDYEFDPNVWPEEQNVHAYRCPVNGTSFFTWVDGQEGGSGRSELPSIVSDNAHKAMQCVHKLSPRSNATYPKIVLFGDSMMRQTFDAFAMAVGMKDVKAVKEFKSLMESQDWGGAEFGAYISFQWAARHNEGRERLVQLLEEGAYVLVNFGAHPLCDGTMMDSLKQFDDWLAFVVALLEAQPSHRQRLAWLGSYPRPVMGYYHMGGSSIYIRTASRDQAWVHYTKTKLEEAGIRHLEIFHMLESFRDCTHDASHHVLGVPNAVATNRIIPWLCSVGHDQAA